MLYKFYSFICAYLYTASNYNRGPPKGVLWICEMATTRGGSSAFYICLQTVVGFTSPHGAVEKENFTPLCQVKVVHSLNSKLTGDFFHSLVHENLGLKPNIGVTRSEKVGLKLNIQKTKIMASGPITSWQIDREALETVSDYFLGAPKSLQMVTAAMKLKDTYSLDGN